MFRKLMVALDGSEFSERALEWAALLAGEKCSVHLVLVHEGRPAAERGVIFISEHVDMQQRDAEDDYLNALADRMRKQRGLDTTVSLQTGTPAAVLTDYAARHSVDLLIMSTHGRGGLSRLWLGSVADQVVRHARRPVLLVRPGDEAGSMPEPSARRVLAAVDGSPLSDTVLSEAARLCMATGADCTIARVVVPPARVTTSRISDTAELVRKRTQEEEAAAEEYLRGLQLTTHWRPTNTRTEVVTGNDAARAILKTAEEEGADIIVIGTRGHGGATRMVLGSVADKVIRGAGVPVLVCPARSVE